MLCSVVGFLALFAFTKGETMQHYIAKGGTLELLHVLFRHGDRTPDPDGLYPNDPYINETYYPFGIGELTNRGKITAYNIGIALRKNYDKFLGDVYTPNIIEVNSSSYSRCKATAQLVLASLFPPVDILRWNNYLNWQPIPYSYLPREQNTMFRPSVCNNFVFYLTESEKKFQTKNLVDNKLVEYIRENSGLNLSVSNLGLQIYSTLKSEVEWGFDLPSWTDKVWPNDIDSFASLCWNIMFNTDDLKTVGAGVLMSKIINDTYSKINGENERKIYLYAGHDATVVAVLSWLGVFKPHSPTYGAYIVFEIHNILNIRAIRILYQKYETHSPIPVIIPRCGTVCPVNIFVELYEKYLATSYEALCS